jgi:methylamine dehydrogenase accessory protein MauD
VSVFLLVLRLLLAGVLTVAGVAKLADRGGTRSAAEGFGVPAWLAGAVGLGLPVLELAIAIALVPAASAPAAGVAALVLLLAFCAAIANAMRRGRVPDCHCFGGLHSAPAGPRTLARNVLLAAAAAGIAAGPALSPVGWPGELTGAERAAVLVAAAAVVVAALSAWMTWQLLRAHGRLLRRIERLEARGTGALPAAGKPAPAFALPGLDGRTVTLDHLRGAGAPVLLVFTDPGCGPCRTLMPAVAGWERGLAGRLTVALVSSGAADRVRAEASDHGLERVLLSPDRTVSRAYRTTGTPSAVLVDADGVLRGEVAAGQPAIEALVESAVGALPAAPAPKLEVVPRRLPTPGPGVGDSVGTIDLPTLDGGRFTLGGRTALLVSWNPGCGFCRRMIDPLRAALAAAPADAPQVVLLARGAEAANRELDLPGVVAVDADAAVAQRLGAGGTPIGILVDAHGRVVAGPAVGADAALALLEEPTPVA